MPFCTPDFETFKQIGAKFDAIPVCRRVLCDGLTPVAAFHRIDDGGTACLFESVIGGEKVGRFSFLAVNPGFEITALDRSVTRKTKKDTQTYEADNPLDEIRSELSKVSVASIDGLPPFTGGAVGYAGYDVIRYTENLPNPPVNDRNLPDMSFAFYDKMLVFDHVTKTLSVIVLAWPQRHDDLQSAYDEANKRIASVLAKLEAPADQLSCDDIPFASQNKSELESNFSPDGFREAVARCVDYIHAGDIFQVVISQRLEKKIDCDPFEIYRTLRVLNPSPFMFFLRTGETTLVGSSPEVMCRVVEGQVTVRPLAGTRKRGENEAEDIRLEKELLSDPKERAEHVMLVDLGRNDVGRVSRYGTVELPEVMVVERYSHVMHISSTVHGMLRDDCDAFDALMASLPAGTVSGAPKVRAMEIIDELEPHRRGPYAGAVGYIDYTGNMDTCIALRTIVIQDQIAYVQAGAGIVADSDAESEYQETVNKARGLLQAIEITQERIERLKT